MNYGKWDKFAAEQSDSDDERAAPSVRTVGDGQAVRIGPQGYELTEKENPTISSPQETSSRVEEIVPEVDVKKWMINGSCGENYYWRQDRQEVTMTVMLTSQVKGKSVRITYDTSNKLLSIEDTSNGSIILCGTFKHGIDTETMTSADANKKALLIIDPADWEVKALTPNIAAPSASTQHTRFLEITFRKVSPLPGATFWWSACFTGETEIDVTKIAGRNISSGTGSSGSTGGKSQEQRLQEDPYVQAQRMFAERIHTQEKIDVDLS